MNHAPLLIERTSGAKYDMRTMKFYGNGALSQAWAAIALTICRIQMYR